MEPVYYTDDTNMRNEDRREDEDEDEDEDVEEDESQLPGFRFYPTDEELVDFYLRRKVENKPFTLDLIKEFDIYKYDPWDLPKSSTIGDNEWYFFCKRGRKYRNSVRPNRVTGSGFWKATGIDKPIRSNDNSIVGLKKSLVYYIGNAGKGTNTDWMMHEFRLPAPLDFITHNSPPSVTILDDTDTTHEAEVWTVCRIFKRNVPSRKYTSNWREISTKRTSGSTSADNIGLAYNSSLELASSSATNKPRVKGESYISFGNNTRFSNHGPQPQVDLFQNPNYMSSTFSQEDNNLTTAIPAGFLGHEQYYGSSSSYNLMPRTHTSMTMAHVTPAQPASSSFYPGTVSPMDSNFYQAGRSNDQPEGTEESWDELGHIWSTFQNQ